MLYVMCITFINKFQFSWGRHKGEAYDFHLVFKNRMFIDKPISIHDKEKGDRMKDFPKFMKSSANLNSASS
jgi:hypothetical protein